MTDRRLRIISVLAALALVVGALVGGADMAAAKKKKKKKKPKTLTCQTFVPGVEAAAEAEVLKVDDTHTEEAPLVIEYEHGPAGPSNPVNGSNLLNEELFFNIQSYSKSPTAGLYILQEFDIDSDLDLYLYNAAGEEIESSGAFNQAPVVTPAVPVVGSIDLSDGGKGGMGYESISGFEVEQCAGYTIRSNAYLTPGTAVTMSIWLGEVVPPEE
jgi:hypothetical protein